MGESHLTRTGQDRVCESTPFLQATFRYPAEGTMVRVGPLHQENLLMSKPRPGAGSPSKAARDNRADQLNPNNDKFYRARGLGGRPETFGGANPPKAQQR